MRRLHKTLAERPEHVLWLIAIYYVAAIAIRVVRADGLQNDEAEQLFQSQFFLLGYSRQPPFYNWLQAGVIQVLGPSIFALALLKNTMLFLCCLFYGLTAWVLMPRNMAAVTAAMLGMLSLPIFAILAQRDLTHAVAALWAVSLFLLGYFMTLVPQASARPRLAGYALTGIAIGIGAIAKYNFVIVPLAALLAALPDAHLRRRIFDWRLLVTIVLAGAIALPHALWVAGHFGIATTGTLNAMRDDATGNRILDILNGLLEIADALIAALVPPLAVFGIAFARQLKSAWAASNMWTALTGRMLVISLALVTVISLLLGATTITQKWLSPYLVVLPLYLCLKLNAAGIDIRAAMPRLAVSVLVYVFGFVVYLAASSVVAPLFGHFPKDSLPSVAFIHDVVDQRGSRPAPGYVITAETVLAGSARLALPQARVLLTSFQQTPGLTDADRRRGGLIIWPARRSRDLPEELAVYLAGQGISAERLTPLTVKTPYPHSDGKTTFRFGYAWIDGR